MIGSLGELDDIYQVDALVVDRKKPRITSAHNERKQVPNVNNQKKARKSSRGDLKVARIQSAAVAHPPKS